MATKRSKKGARKTLDKDLKLVSSIGRWLVVIALSGIALSLLVTIVAIVIFATIVVPRMRLLADRLKKSPAMHGSTKEKCVAFFTEAGRMLMPDDSDESVAASAENACGTSRQVAAGAQMFDAVVSDPARASHAASMAAAARHAHATASKAKATEAGLPPGPQEPEGHPADSETTPATAAAPALGLGVHS